VKTELPEKLARVKIVAMDVDGTFTDGMLYYDHAGNVMKGFFVHDGLGIDLLRRARIKWGFITGRSDSATESRARFLQADFYLYGVGDKSEALRKLSQEQGVPLSEILYIGDDLNDYTAFETAGVTVAVGDAAEEIRLIADYVTNAPGGRGAVRETVNLLLKARGIDTVALWKTESNRTVGKQ
jgi:3-deoxy-D-manno-octulosonate 8-phosphate phosphatase (KDO 8-P phosphatase)